HGRVRVAGAGLRAVPAAFGAVPSGWATLHGVFVPRRVRASLADYAAAARAGDRLAIAKQHVAIALLWTFGGGVSWYLPWLLGRFLLGFLAGAQRWFDRDGADHLPLFHRMLRWGALATLAWVGLRVPQSTEVY